VPGCDIGTSGVSTPDNAQRYSITYLRPAFTCGDFARELLCEAPVCPPDGQLGSRMGGDTDLFFRKIQGKGVCLRL